MIELSNEYINALASQIAFMSTFLGGFSATILGALVLSERNDKLIKRLVISFSLSTCLFIIVVFAMTNLIMLTTPGYPLPTANSDTFLSKTIGILSFMLAIITLLISIAIMGWLKSKKIGIVTTCFGVISLLFILILLT